MKVFFIYLFLTFVALSCVKNPTKESAKVIKKSEISKTTDKNEKDCDSGEKVLKKIEVKKESLSLNNLESGCSIDGKDTDDLKF